MKLPVHRFINTKGKRDALSAAHPKKMNLQDDTTNRQVIRACLINRDVPGSERFFRVVKTNFRRNTLCTLRKFVNATRKKSRFPGILSFFKHARKRDCC